MHNHHLGVTGSAHPTNLEAAKEEYATVIKHVMKRDVLSSFLPVGVNCKRLPNLESHSIKLQSSGLVLSPMRSQEWLSISQEWYCSGSKECAQFLKKMSLGITMKDLSPCWLFTAPVVLLPNFTYKQSTQAPPREIPTEKLHRYPYHQQLQHQQKRRVMERNSKAVINTQKG